MVGPFTFSIYKYNERPLRPVSVSFPHYFLQATGHLADQLKTREWIVARMTSITEHVVDHNVCRQVEV